MDESKHRLVYIAGDGRSGSSLLSLLLNTADHSIFVGECYRFWKRYYSSPVSICGCTATLTECAFWNTVHTKLSNRFEDYNGQQVWEQIQFLLKYRNAQKLEKILRTPEWGRFVAIVRYFYDLLFEISKATTVIDSSKDTGWARLLHFLGIKNLSMIYLKREMLAVANSWKKKVYLPEFKDKLIPMPIKSNWNIVKSRIKIERLLAPLKKQPCFYTLLYSDLVLKTESTLNRLQEVLELPLGTYPYYHTKPHHAIGGNPMLYTMRLGDRILVEPPSILYPNLSRWDRLFFTLFPYL